jgi:hypothetical protein
MNNHILLVNIFVLGLIASWWSTNSWQNIICKALLWAITLWNCGIYFNKF